jgi:class 3 adenylate cyclase
MHVKRPSNCGVARQLDICDYTTLSSTRRPLELAQSVNMLFSEFDRAVTGRNLFKVDTIGDAYIIVGWLHKSHCPSESWDASSLACLAGMAEATRDLELEDVQQCADMLCVAGDMQEIVNRLRSQTTIHWNVRIGIAIGSVIAGMLGKHQMRFSVLGEAMQHIARLETMGQPGRVHCSADFVNFVSSRLEGRRCLGQWHVERVHNAAISRDRSLGQVQLGSFMLSRIVQEDQMDAVSPRST